MNGNGSGVRSPDDEAIGGGPDMSYPDLFAAISDWLFDDSEFLEDLE